MNLLIHLTPAGTLDWKRAAKGERWHSGRRSLDECVKEAALPTPHVIEFLNSSERERT